MESGCLRRLDVWYISGHMLLGCLHNLAVGPEFHGGVLQRLAVLSHGRQHHDLAGPELRCSAKPLCATASLGARNMHAPARGRWSCGATCCCA